MITDLAGAQLVRFRMSEDNAIAIAKEAALKNGWSWIGRVSVAKRGWLFGRRKWEVTSNADMLGCNVRVLIRDADGAILRAGFLPR